jgi:hypothetical protein
MCYNAEVSGGTFLFVSLISFWLWQRNSGIDRPIAGILFFISVMQALEWILWLNLDCNWLNKLITRLIPIYISLQPVIVNLIVWHFGAGWAPGYLQLALLCLAFVPFVIWRNQSIQGQCVKVSTGGNLVWPGIPGEGWDSYLIRLIYYPSLLYPIITLNNTLFSGLYAVFACLSIFIMSAKSKEAWPSLWCHFVNFLAVFAVVRPSP